LNVPNESNATEKENLIAELQQLGIKHTPEAIVRITKTSQDKIIFLERGKGGDNGSGLTHIIENHQQDFVNRGIPEDLIPDAIITAITQGKAIGTQGKSRRIYQVEINGILQYISVEISINGYIVGANPTSNRLINKLTKG
jgi:filamentous hemagglutinin